MLNNHQTFLSRNALAALLACGTVFTLLLAAPSEVKAQDDQTPAEVIKVYSNLVSVPVIVSDRDGRYISGLREQDFQLYDNTVAQKLAYFDAAEAPLNVALMLDTSRSTEGVIDDRLKVKVDKPEIAVRARTQYRATEPSSTLKTESN